MAQGVVAVIVNAFMIQRSMGTEHSFAMEMVTFTGVERSRLKYCCTT